MFASGYLAGASQFSFANLKLLCWSVGGTPRSSTQNRCTLSQASLVRPKYWYIGLGEEPPEMASAALFRSEMARCNSSTTRAPHASAAARVPGNRCVGKIHHDRIGFYPSAITHNGKQK